MLRDLAVVAQVYLILFGLQLLAWPWVYKLFHQLMDRGWATGRVLITIGLATIVWWLGHLKIPANTTAGVSLILLVIISLTWLRLHKEIKKALVFLRHHWKLIALEESLFLIGLIGFAWVRAHQPDIFGLEKFMDYGFIKSYLNSPTLPAMDMWLAGKTINYYSFGHFWASILIRIWGVRSEVGYNLMLAFLFGSSLSIAFSIIINLCKRFSFKTAVGGLIGSLLVTVGGNTHTISSLIKKSNLNGYWYADATRFIHNSIHEFPSYSFVVSDLHAHLLGLPIVLIFILLLTIWVREEKNWILDVILGWLLGTMMMTNTWDVASYTMLLTVVALLRLVTTQNGVSWIIVSLIRVYFFTAVAVVIWLLNFSSISNGMGIVVERSPLWQLAYLWTIHLVFTVAAGIVYISRLRKKTLENIIIPALIASAILLIITPEFVYVKDIYTSNPRANTMFKLTFQAFVMMSLLAGWTVAKVLSLPADRQVLRHRTLRIIGTVLIMLMFGALMLFPIEAYRSYYDGLKTYHGLNGTAYLLASDTNEVEMITYLSKNRNQKNMIEAVGDSFTDFNAISAYTGIPTVVGWRAHEWLWRNGYDEVGKRDGEITSFYASANDAKELIKKYNIGWVVVSRREREKYQIDEAGLKMLGKIVWEKGNEYLIRVE